MPRRPRVSVRDDEIRERICELCRVFFNHGWVSGTGGGISIRDGDRIFMAPSGVQKERLDPADIFTLSLSGEILSEPGRGLRISACRPLFLAAYRLRHAGAVLHTHSLNAVLATRISGPVFRISGVEMQKGIEGYGNDETLEVPIIENRPEEGELAQDMERAIRDFKRTQGVLVRGHGAYIWGQDWIQAKTQAECYDFLFEAAVRIKLLEK
jgi:methylthioribulose-1-phosphate dehydratase